MHGPLLRICQGVPIQSIFINHVCPRDQHSSLRRPSLRGGAHDNEPLASLVEKRCIFAVLRPTSPAHLASRTVQFRTKLLAQVFLLRLGAQKLLLRSTFSSPFHCSSRRLPPRLVQVWLTEPLDYERSARSRE